MQQLVSDVGQETQTLFRVSEGIAMLDMVCSLHKEKAGLRVNGADFVVCKPVHRPGLWCFFLQILQENLQADVWCCAVRPEFTDTLAIKAGRHPIREKIHNEAYVPNDVYASQQSR